MGGHEQQPVPAWVDRPVRKLTHGHLLVGSRSPWTAQWASGHTDTSPLSPWWLLRRSTAVAFAITLFPGEHAREQAELRAHRHALAAMPIAITAAEEAHLRGGGRG